MMIGPAPMMRMRMMSVRFGMYFFSIELHEAIEQVADVVRPGARFRMPLEAERRLVRVT
jgi:DhnA family fructose-bisphosphate aldolase class Ia